MHLLLSGRAVVELILLLAPLGALVLIGVVWRRSSAHLEEHGGATALGFCLFVLVLTLPRALMEVGWAFHVDLPATFALLLSFVCFGNAMSTNEGAAGVPTSALVWLLVAVVGKEDVAALAVLGYLWLALRTRRRDARILLLTALAVLAIAALTIRLSANPFTRGNGRLIAAAMDNLVTRPELWLQLGLPLFLGLAVVSILLAVVARRDAPSMLGDALLLVGAARASFAVLAQDFDPLTWHNYPTWVFLAASVWVRLTTPSAAAARRVAALSVVVLLAYWGVKEIPATWRLANAIGDPAAERAEFQALVEEADPAELHAVDKRGVVEWVIHQRRFVEFPRGVSLLPVGLADVAVLSRSTYERGNPALRCFQVERETRHFVKLRRTRICEDYNKHRELFLELYGTASVR